jgi:serine/threonine protein kinase
LKNEVDSALSFTLSTVRGTLVWMAPELHKSSSIDLAAAKADGKSIRGSTASDVFSFGLVSFYFLTKGVHPFGSLESKKKIYTETIPNIINKNPINLESN